MNAQPAEGSEGKVNLEAVFNSLTGFDEIAMEQRFGMGIQDLQAKPTMAVRAVLFIDFRRGGLDDTAAYKQVMSLPLSEVMERVETPEDDEDEAPAPLALTPGL